MNRSQKVLLFLPSWVQASLLVMTLSVLGKVLGLWRELETARLFGVSTSVDAFVAAYTLLIFVARMGSDSFQVSTPRLLVEYRVQGEQGALWGNLIRALLLVSIILTLLAAVLLPRLVPVVFNGLDLQGQQLTVKLVIWLLPMVAGWTLLGGLGGVLNSQHRYGGNQIALLVANLGVLGVLWVAAPGVGIIALSQGWSVGIWLGVGVVALLLRTEMRRLWRWDGWRQQWDVLKSLVAGANGLFLWFALTQMPIWLDRYFTAQLAPGSLATLGYAQRLFQLPLELMTTVVMSVWVPHVAQMSRAKVVPATWQVMRRLALITFPVAGVLALLAQPIVTLVYRRGAFDALAVGVTTGPFLMYALGLGFHTLSAVLVRSFQARGLGRLPVLAACADILLTGVLDAWVVGAGWGATGIAGVNTLVAGVRVGILSICLYKLAARERYGLAV